MTPYALQSAVEARDAAALEILLDAEEEGGLDAAEVYARAESIAHDTAQLIGLRRDGTLDYTAISIRIAGQSVDVEAAWDHARILRLMGRWDEAEVIERDSHDAIVAELERLIGRRAL